MVSSMILHHKICVAILMICAFFIIGELYVTLPMISNIASYYRVDSTTASWLSLSFGLSYAVGFLITSPLSDKFGRDKVIFYGLLSMGIATVPVSFVPSFRWLIIFRIIQDLCVASFPPAPLAQYVGGVFAVHGMNEPLRLMTSLYLLYQLL